MAVTAAKRTESDIVPFVQALQRFLARILGLQQSVQEGVIILGGRAAPGRDIYHGLLRAPWITTILVIASSFLGMNLLFACIYYTVGGISNVNGFDDAYYFSVHTMATIGYGSMVPMTTLTNWLVIFEAIVGLLVTALSTGLVFAKFSTPTARIRFAKSCVVQTMNGVPTLAMRIGNERGNGVIDAMIRVSAMLTERLEEGGVFYRSIDLVLARERAPILSRTWTILHPITEKSPLFGLSHEELKKRELELMITVSGTDETTIQPVLARHTYEVESLHFNARLADTLREIEGGKLEVNLHRFDEIEPVENKTERSV
jgi:inward rectifier potassium channel